MADRDRLILADDEGIADDLPGVVDRLTNAIYTLYPVILQDIDSLNEWIDEIGDTTPIHEDWWSDFVALLQLAVNRCDWDRVAAIALRLAETPVLSPERGEP
jgi:hypothetical protein